MNLTLILFIAISLSMDAFSLAISMGTINFAKKKNITLAIIVGAFHFFMPLLGSIIGTWFIRVISFDTQFISAIIFAYIGIQMIKELSSENEFIKKFNFIEMLTFALGVSLDSLGVGFTFANSYIITYGFIFAFFSFTFTLTGLFLGNILNRFIGVYASYLGAFIMFMMSLINFVKFCLFN